uniref:LIM zinc-binding domain-containing protein n=1 Tax=Photinus pyralis TaxID=7054 RepID=A0A1Y1LFR6_PHOPY
MENIQDLTDKEASERRNSNTEWLLTKCRITKPPPPKPATNPLQFIKVAPCPLFQKAHEQIKKVEEIKIMRQDMNDDAEEWQQNLDNWKSSRRKRQEHIIERVVEVKKIEQEGHDRSRRKSKTFSEMLEERNKRGQKLNILVYNDDENDLSDYGIGNTHSKSNGSKDADTDDSCSLLDDKDHMSDTQSQDTSNISNQSQSEDESLNLPSIDKENNFIDTKLLLNKDSSKAADISRKSDTVCNYDLNRSSVSQEPPRYTYEGAIQDYRSRIKLKTNIDDKFLQKPDYKKQAESQNIPKVDIYKRKEMFEVEKPLEIHHLESSTSRRLSEDFVNTQSIKDRLKSLEKCTEQPLKSVDKCASQVNSVKSRVVSLNKQTEEDSENNNSLSNSKSSKMQSPPKSISSYLNDNVNVKYKNRDWHVKDEVSERCSSPEAEMYMNQLNMFNRDLDAFLQKSHSSHNDLEDDCESCNYPSSNLSADIIGLSSDREDSGIHTADVSCSVSQADEPVDDSDLSSTTIPHCIEKLNKEKELQQVSGDDLLLKPDYSTTNSKALINKTREFLSSVRHQSDVDLATEKEHVASKPLPAASNKNTPFMDRETLIFPIQENVDVKRNVFCDSTFPLAPPKTTEPPKEKPPPPPPVLEDNLEHAPEDNLALLNSTKRLKKEIHIKRSSFLGLDEPTHEQLDPEIMLDKPPDINSFLQKESQLEKSFYKKLQGSRDNCLSEVESQDSGLESERGRLSSDTWCSSVCDLSTPTHGRQDSEQTNSEDEIMKKEREIIELIEKEEKSRDDYSTSMNNVQDTFNYSNNAAINQHFTKNYLPSSHNVDYTRSFNDEDSEVLKVEHELLQLEREELERRRDNIAFRENHSQKYLQNGRRSYENICDSTHVYPPYDNFNYRKSLPDLQHQDYHNSAPSELYFKTALNVQLQTHKSMPDIQQLYQKLTPEHKKSNSTPHNDKHLIVTHRKSMPELQFEKMVPIFNPPHLINRQPIIAGKPLKLPNKEQRDKGRYMMVESESTHFQHIKPGRPITRPGIHALSAVPKSRPLSNDNWIQPKCNLENKSKSYDQHWLYQEAELRRLEEQQRNSSPKRIGTPKKHIPEPIIETLTQRVQHRNDRYQPIRRPNNSSNEFAQHTYLNHPHTMGHASPLSYPPPATLEDSQGVMLSVSGKKKCSYCNNELGRGAAMIIESLCLFYHMECFKCCVCHTQLGDGLMGTDVRVRNQKLHCHNCYSSDDGVKFSCV